MKTKFLVSLLSFIGITFSHGASTLLFSTASAKLTNIQNAAGNATGGLRWGIVVDTTGNGFDASGLNYDGFTFPSAGSGTFLANGTGTAVTDDFFYFAASGNTTLPSAGGTDSGTNVISQLGNLAYVSGVTAGDPFALIWFDTTTTNDGDKYGFLTIPAFVVPADGTAAADFSGNFLGADPVRLASNTLGTSPEPSRLMLLGLAGLGMFFRRRRC